MPHFAPPRSADAGKTAASLTRSNQQYAVLAGQYDALTPRLAATGGKFFSGPLAVLNPWVKWRQQPYCTTFANYHAPWRRLFAARGITLVHWQARYSSIAYIAGARLAAEDAGETKRTTFA